MKALMKLGADPTKGMQLQAGVGKVRNVVTKEAGLCQKTVSWIAETL